MFLIIAERLVLNMLKILFLCILIIFSISCSSRHSPYSYKENIGSHPSQSGSHYLVKKGDSLWQISKKYGVSVQDLMKYNKIHSARKLKEGDCIIIPYQNVEKVNAGNFYWPIKGEVINYFGDFVSNVVNKGIDIKVEKEGRGDVFACADGQIVFENYLKGWGNTLILKHPDSFYTIYANIVNTTVKEGRTVKAKETLGNVPVGSAGNRVFHFEIRRKNLALDPLKYLR